MFASYMNINICFPVKLIFLMNLSQLSNLFSNFVVINYWLNKTNIKLIDTMSRGYTHIIPGRPPQYTRVLLYTHQYVNAYTPHHYIDLYAPPKTPTNTYL